MPQKLRTYSPQVKGNFRCRESCVPKLAAETRIPRKRETATGKQKQACIQEWSRHSSRCLNACMWRSAAPEKTRQGKMKPIELLKWVDVGHG